MSKLHEALGAYRSAVLSGEQETPSLKARYDAAFAEAAQHAQTLRAIERCLRDGQSLAWLTSNDVRAVADWLAPEAK